MNVLHVISDQHNAACMGVEGHPYAITPHMDRLAAEGVRFTRASPVIRRRRKRVEPGGCPETPSRRADLVYLSENPRPVMHRSGVPCSGHFLLRERLQQVAHFAARRHDHLPAFVGNLPHGGQATFGG